MLARCAALYLQPAQTGWAGHDAAYSLATNAWDVPLPVRENSIVIPQLGAFNASCPGSSVLMKCAELQRTAGDDAWRNDAAAAMRDAICALQSRDAAQAVQERVVCALGGFVCMLFPSGLRIQNNATALERHGGPAHVVALRLLHVTFVANMYMVHTQCLRVRTKAPRLAGSAVSVSNVCVRRGLQAPAFASMREAGGTCVWYCVVDRLRAPWNSDPPANASASGHRCRPVPENFVAVDFVLQLELSLSSVVPRLLQPEVLRWLNAVSNLTEQHMQQRTGMRGFATVLSVPGSVYHTHDLQTLAPAVIRARRAEYDSIALRTEWRGHALRRRLGSTDVAVQGVHIMPAMLLSDAAWLLFAEQATRQAAARAPALEGVLQLSLRTSTVLHRPKLADAPPEVIFSESDVEILFAALLLVLLYCVLVACCDVARRAHRRCVLRWAG